MLNFKNIDRFYKQNSEIVLKNGSPWSKFILLKPNDSDYEPTKQLLLNHPNIKFILSQIRDKKVGINSLDNSPADFCLYSSFYWTLRFLADIGISAEALGIKDLLKKILLQQSDDGQFIIRYYKKRQQEISLVCMTAHLTYCLIRLGFQDSPTVDAAKKYICSSQRNDGGWHCEKLRQNGERNEKFPSCPAATVHVLRVLGQFGNKYMSKFAICPDNHLSVLNASFPDFCHYNSEKNLNYSKLRYPPHFTGMDILNVTDSYSYLPNISQNKSYNQLINKVLCRWDGSHLLCSEKRMTTWSMFDFGHNNHSSDWITALFLSTLNRAYFQL